MRISPSLVRFCNCRIPERNQLASPPTTRRSSALHFSCAKHISNLVEIIAMPRQGLCGGMGFEIFQRKPGYIALAFVAQQSRCLLQQGPESALHFDSHLWDDVVDAAGMVTQ